MIYGKYVIVALFDFKDYPIFTELVGIAHDSKEAFWALENYDYKKVIASKYEMTIEEKRMAKEFGSRSITKKAYYEEHHHLEYQIKGEEEKYPVEVTITIFES